MTPRKIYQNELRVAIQAARSAGNVLMRHYGKLTHIDYKRNNDIVTIADTQAEMRILSIIQRNFPSHATYSEEAGKRRTGSEYLWIIDPLDGTTNYTAQNPFFNVSIALNHNTETVLGVVYNPYTNELFSAVQGHGATLNGQTIQCSTREDLGKAFVAFCYGSKQQGQVRSAVRLFSRMKPEIKHLRQIGAAALELSYVAAGRIDAFWMSHLNAYDVAAGALIAKEAGCTVTDFHGRPFTTQAQHILAANPKIHPKLLRMVRKF